jgi:hypothetical protein
MICQDAAIYCNEDDPFCTSRELHFMRCKRRLDVAWFRLMHEYMLMDMYEIFVGSLFKGLRNHDRGFEAFVRLLHGVLYYPSPPAGPCISKSVDNARSPKYVTL